MFTALIKLSASPSKRQQIWICVHLAQHRSRHSGDCARSLLGIGDFLPPLFCVDASREWHVVKNKPTGEKLEETFLRSLIWGSSLKGNSLKAHSYIPPVPPALKYMNEFMYILKQTRVLKCNEVLTFRMLCI